jgi:hypothetical protein
MLVYSYAHTLIRSYTHASIRPRAVSKLIKLEEDDDDEELMKGSKLKTDLTLHDSWK